MPWAVLAALSLLPGAWAQGPDWSHAGPATVQSAGWGAVAGPIAALALGADGVTIYAAGAGGVWERTATGWTALGPNEPVTALAVTSSGEFVAGTPAGLFTDLPSGGGWNAAPVGILSGFTITQIAIDPGNPQHWLVDTTGGLFTTADAGARFASTAITDPVLAFGWQGASLLAVTASAVEISADDGATFTPVSGLSPAASPPAWTSAAIAVRSDGSFLVLLQGANPQLLTVAASGATATSLPLPNDWDHLATPVAVAATSAALWISGRDLWMQSSGGTWVNLTTSDTANAAVPAEQMAILPLPNGGVVLGNHDGVWSWQTGTWANWNSGLNNPAPTALAWTASGNLAAVLPGGLLALGSGASAAGTWAAAASGPQQLTTDPAVANGLYGGEASGLLRSADGGNNWTAMPLPGSPAVTAVAADDAGALVGTADGQLVTTTATTPVSPAAGHAITTLASSNDGSQLWLAAGSQLWSSKDGGANWQSQATPFGAVSAMAVSPANPSVIAAVTPAGVAVSWSGGNGWTLLESGMPPGLPLTALSWDANQVLWAATYGQGLWSLAPSAPTLNLNLKVAATSAAVGTEVPFVLTAKSAQGPLAGAGITVSVSVNGNSGPSQSLTTASDGSASGMLTMPAQTGSATVIAAWTGSSQPLLSNPQQVQLTSGTAATLVVISGANQQQTEGQMLAQAVVVQLSDAAGNGLAGQTLVVTGPEGFTQNLTTDGSGQARLVNYRLPSTPGPVTLMATFASLTANWIETALPLPDYRISLSAPAAAAGPGTVAQMALQIVPVGLFSSAVSVTCLPDPGCTIVQAGQAVSALTPGTMATTELEVGNLGSSLSAITVTVQSDATHVASVSVPLQSLSVSVGAASATLSAGQSEQIPVTVRGVNGLAAAIELSVTGAGGAMAANLDAAVQPALVNISDAGATITAQLQIEAAVAAGSPPRGPWWPWILLGGLLAGLIVSARRRRRVVAVAAIASLACACGGSAAMLPLKPLIPPPIQTTLVITASGGGLQTSAQLPVTITAP